MLTNKPLNGIHLKLIACAAMFIDHACKALFWVNPTAHILSDTVGRIAFPIFAYLVLEGFLHTHSRKKYAINLLIAALISEVFFDRVLHGTWFYPMHQNTCFTLLLGLLFLITLEKCEQDRKFRDQKFRDRKFQGKKFLLMIVAVAGFGVLFRLTRVDYGLSAFIIFFALYLLKYQQPAFSALIMSTVILIVSKTAGVCLCLIPFFFYNRKRGNMPAAGKYLFYAFYPAHLAILTVMILLR